LSREKKKKNKKKIPWGGGGGEKETGGRAFGFERFSPQVPFPDEKKGEMERRWSEGLVSERSLGSQEKGRDISCKSVRGRTHEKKWCPSRLRWRKKKFRGSA